MNTTLRKTAVACALMMFAFAGLTTNGFAAYQPYIVSVNGFSNTQGSTVLTIRNIGSLTAMLLGGIIYRKISIRRGVTFAGICAGSGLLLFSHTHSFLGYCISGFIMGISFGLGGMIPLTIVSVHGFGNEKTKMLGICAAMTGLSTLGFPFLIVSITEKYGLSAMFRAEGIFEFIAAAIIYLLMKAGPADSIFDEEKQTEKRSTVSYSPLSHKENVLFFFIALLAGAPSFAGITHLSVLCTGEGLSSKTAAAAVMVSGISLTISKALYGNVKEKLGPFGSQILYGTMLISSQLLFTFIGRNSIILYLSMILFSAGLAFFTVGIADWAGALAPMGKQARLIQISQIGYMAGGFAFSSLPGIIADGNGGSYVGGYLVFAGLSFLAILLNIILCIKHRSKDS